MRAVRVLLALAGVSAAGFGLWTLRDDEVDKLVAAVTWLIGGVILHDAILAPCVLGVGVLVARFAPAYWHKPMVIGTIVWGSVTLVAIPVLGTFGARDDNPSLLDRPYFVTWLVATFVVAIAVAVTATAAGRRGRA